MIDTLIYPACVSHQQVKCNKKARRMPTELGLIFLTHFRAVDGEASVPTQQKTARKVLHRLHGKGSAATCQVRGKPEGKTMIGLGTVLRLLCPLPFSS